MRAGIIMSKCSVYHDVVKRKDEGVSGLPALAPSSQKPETYNCNGLKQAVTKYLITVIKRYSRHQCAKM